MLDRAHIATVGTNEEVPSSRQLDSRDSPVLRRCTPTFVAAIVEFENVTESADVDPRTLLAALDDYRRPDGTVSRRDIPGWPADHPTLEIGQALTAGLLHRGEAGEAPNPATTAILIAIAHEAITAVGLHIARQAAAATATVAAAPPIAA